MIRIESAAHDRPLGLIQPVPPTGRTLAFGRGVGLAELADDVGNVIPPDVEPQVLRDRDPQHRPIVALLVSLENEPPWYFGKAQQRGTAAGDHPRRRR